MKNFACLLVILSLALLVMAGCKDSDVRAASRAAAGIASGLSQLQSQNESWYAAKKLTPGETIAIADAIGDATLVNDEFVAHVRALQNVNAKDAGSIVIYAQLVVGSIEKLNLTVSSVADPEVRQKLQLVLTSIEASLNVLRSLLVQYPAVPPKPVAFLTSSNFGGKDGREDGTARSRCAERRREVGGGVEGAGSFDGRAVARLRGTAGRQLARPYTAVHFARQERSSRLITVS
jgi:hypothetical protein